MGIPAQRSTLAVVLVGTLIAFSGQSVFAQDDLVGVLSTGSFSKFWQLVQGAQLVDYVNEVYKKNDTLTIFAPRNAYLDNNVDANILAFLQKPENLALYQEVVKFHFVEGPVNLKGAAEQTFPSGSGDILTVKYDAGSDRATVEMGTPVKRPNAIIIDSPPAVVHGIDGLLIPPPVVDALKAGGVLSPPAAGPTPAAVPPTALPPVVPGPTAPVATPPTVPGPSPPVALPPTVPGPIPPVVPGPATPPVTPGPTPPVLPPSVPSAGPTPPAVVPPASGPSAPPAGPAAGPAATPPGVLLPPAMAPGSSAPTPAASPAVPPAAAPAAAPLPPPGGASILKSLEDGDHTTFLADLSAANLTDDVSNIRQPVTILAPNDAAFATLEKGLSPKAKEALAAKDSPLLKDIMKNHIILGNYSKATLLAATAAGPVVVPTLAGEDVTVTQDPAGALVISQANKAGVTKEIASDPATGATHDLDTVLLSPSVEKQIAALDSSAPAGAPGSSPTGNGIIPALKADGSYGTLLSAVNDSGLTPTIDGYAGEVTVLAPTDKAFKDADPQVQAALKDPELKKKILAHHIIPSYVTLPLLAASAPTTYTSKEGSPIPVTTSGSDVVFQGTATGIKPEVKSSGSTAVIGIDHVLIPDDIKTAVYGSGPAPAGSKKHKKHHKCGAVCIGIICGILGALALLVCCWAIFAAGSKRKREDESGDKLPGEADGPRARRLTI